MRTSWAEIGDEGLKDEPCGHAAPGTM